MASPSDLLDCIIIGAGAAGSTAALYLARFRRRIALLDADASRLRSIPTSHNYPGHSAGIHGHDILLRLREQLAHYGVERITGAVERLDKLSDGCFVAHIGGQQWHAATVILATGVVDVEPSLAEVKHAVAAGCIRYCPICDGFEASGKKVAVIGRGQGGLDEALFVSHFASEVALFSIEEAFQFTNADRARIAQEAIQVAQAPLASLQFHDAGFITLSTRDGQQHRFDMAYIALGTLVNSGLAQTLGARCSANGELVVDDHQQTSVPGLYAAGDIVVGLNQIVVAMGHAAIAATAVHNRLGRASDNAQRAKRF